MLLCSLFVIMLCVRATESSNPYVRSFVSALFCAGMIHFSLWQHSSPICHFLFCNLSEFPAVFIIKACIGVLKIR